MELLILVEATGEWVQATPQMLQEILERLRAEHAAIAHPTEVGDDSDKQALEDEWNLILQDLEARIRDLSAILEHCLEVG